LSGRIIVHFAFVAVAWTGVHTQTN
jgi:hypothetical protein